MTWNIALDAEGGSLRLEGELNIYSVAEIHERIKDVLGSRDEIEIALDGVSDIDTAGLQLMLLTKRMPGKEVRFVRHSAEVLRIVDLANVGQILGDPLVLGAGVEEQG